MLAINYDNYNIRVLGNKEEPLFCAKDICKILGLKNYSTTIKCIDDDYKCGHHSMDSVGRKNYITFLKEPGLYQLIFKSRLPIAKEFEKFILCEVLPSIRKHGKYPIEEIKKSVNTNNKIYIATENDLHISVIKFIKNKLNDYFLIVPTLGELQNNDEKRIEAYNKGYQKGSPDVILIGKNHKYDGVALEFKTPKGTNDINEYQRQTLNNFKGKNYKLIVSNSFTDILYKLMKYCNKIDLYHNRHILKCMKCLKVYKTKKYYINHLIECI